ncbi:ATP-dependent Clp protease ATP-binding subunit [Ruminococcaceae bacterium OttesenSCG-928-A11]|nr:ATP-dependent Clp protease ATP-binding subunit [Ruminococcaceae bacterium OttesenSCG-928-A11]
MFEFRSPVTKNVVASLEHAQKVAIETGSDQLSTEHLLLGILAQKDSRGATVLANQDINYEKVKTRVTVNTERKTGIRQIVMSEALILTLQMAGDIVQNLDLDFIGTEHILHAMIYQTTIHSTKILIELGLDIQKAVNDLEDYFTEQNYEPITEGGARNRGGRGSFLNKFAVNLSEKAIRGELDPVVGRRNEIMRTITILSRRTKNNPVLIGEPGVGKTAIVEGLAQKIANDDVPEYLANKKVYQLDLPGMVAGTKYRGEFEERLKRVIDEVRTDKNVIIFIDELHLLIGAGGGNGAMDAANILKPALARGEFRLIGATTLEEYRKHIEKDSALARRLQPIVVDEPSSSDTIKILEGLSKNYEVFHNVKLSKPVIEEAVRLSGRYITDRFFPDKAIDVIDEASASARVRETAAPSKELKKLRQELNILNDKMDEAVAVEDFEKAAMYKMQIARIKERLTEISKDLPEKSEIILKVTDVANAVSTISGIPVSQLRRDEISKLNNLEKHLAKQIIGQEDAIKAVSRAIRRSRSGISNARRPIGSFIFLGPTGVGKTELARVLAREVFGSDKSLIKIDMSEFSEKHNTSRLLGAPAGYVGYDDGGQLTDKIRRQPYSVVLFDEIEKAHPEVFNMLLQLLEDGRLTDGQGRETDFSNAIIILTSNLGSDMMGKGSLGFNNSDKKASNRDIVLNTLKQTMRPELINRFDDIVVFDSLNRSQVGQIFDLQISELNERLLAKGLILKVSAPAKRYLTDKGYDEKYGARPLRRVIQDELEHPIANGIINKNFKKGDILEAIVKDKKILITKTTE